MPTARKTPKVRNLILFSTIIMVLFMAIVGYQARQTYDTAINHGRRDAELGERVRDVARRLGVLARHVLDALAAQRF